jgi:hypothetical protein
MWQYPSLFSEGLHFSLNFLKFKVHLNILKTTSGSSSGTDLSNYITFSQSQSHAKIPLNLFCREQQGREKGMTELGMGGHFLSFSHY